MREDGFYWCKHPTFGWEVCKFECDTWLCCGGGGEFCDADFDQIDERRIVREVE